MHIEPGVVDGAKVLLGYATAARSFGVVAKMVARGHRTNGGARAFAARGALATALVVIFFEVLPHQAVGVSEVHLILGSTLFLLFGAGPAEIGLALGLLLQGRFFAPPDQRTIPQSTAYVDLSYGQVLKLSITYQAGVVAWVAFWVTYGRGVSVENLAAIGVFSLAYMSVIVVEPLVDVDVDVAVLAGAKALHKLTSAPLFHARLLRPAG